MTTAPVTVVIPAFNRQTQIRQALQSVFEQTLPPAEVLVVDDGSTDASGAVAQSLGARVVRQANGGPASARNAGMAAATQPWIAFCDSDDFWHPAKLERQWRALERSDALIAFADFTVDRSPRSSVRGLDCAEYRAIQKQPLGDCIVELLPPTLGWQVARSNFLQLSSLIVRRDLLERTGGFNESLRYCEDHEFVLRLLRHSAVVAVEEVLATYRACGKRLSTNEAAMRRGDLLVAGMVSAAPDRYAAGAAGVLHAARARKRRNLALARLKNGALHLVRGIAK